MDDEFSHTANLEPVLNGFYWRRLEFSIRGSRTRIGTLRRRSRTNEVLPILAERENMHLIVVGTVMRNGLEEFATGNTAEKMLHSVEHSVLAMKPEGFAIPFGRQPPHSADCDQTLLTLRSR